MKSNLIKKDIWGFTLWEVLLVLLLLSTITLVGVPKFITTSDYVKAEGNKVNLIKIEKAVQLYYLDTGSYPDKLESLLSNPRDRKDWRGPYLDEYPVYPFSQDTRYALDARGKVVLQKI